MCIFLMLQKKERLEKDKYNLEKSLEECKYTMQIFSITVYKICHIC